jgi:HEAT repeat protein
MIDFSDRHAFSSARAFLAHYRGDPAGLPRDDFRHIADYLLARQRGEEELLLELSSWEDRELEAFLSACWRSGAYEALSLAGSLLGRRGTVGLTHWLESVLADEGGARWLVDVLAEVYDDDSTRLLIRLLDHPVLSIRRRAGDGLSSHRGTLDLRSFLRHLAFPLVNSLSHPDPLAAVRALHRIADPALPPDFGRDAAQRAERILIQCVRHERRSPVRGDAVAALGELGSRRAVHCLVDLLGREERGLHRDVVIALRKIRPEKAVLALLQLLQSPDPMIREEAANALGEIGDRQAIKRLRELLEDRNRDVRQEAVLALGKLGGGDVLETLEAALADSDSQVRMAACAALAESLGPLAQGRLISALYDGAPEVRSEAAYQLGDVGDEHARVHLQGRLEDRARDAFGDTVASTARKSLNRIELALRQTAGPQDECCGQARTRGKGKARGQARAQAPGEARAGARGQAQADARSDARGQAPGPDQDAAMDPADGGAQCSPSPAQATRSA